MSAYHSAMPNRLAGETSPYLLQHAHNPVDWFPWGKEALDRAKSEDRPILLSIGYSACHWCHVMERESFEDAATAKLMNDHFVSIKVDREERPDLDGIYMQAVQAMTGHGGWPMTVFLTPDGTPFYGGTYYPPDDRPNMPSFTRVLLSIADAWRTRRDEVLNSGQQLRDHLQQAMTPAPSRRILDTSLLDAALQGVMTQYEPIHAGFGNAPKFPQPMAIEFLLRQWQRTTNEPALQAVTATLDAMAHGGMYDQLGGGFHRYSTDAEWLVPHFEKMLYDNGQLARGYVHAWTLTRDARYRAVATGTLDYMLRELRTPDGAFAASQDADTEGIEGLTFTWRATEVADVLDEEAPLFGAAYGVTEAGNWEGVTILSRVVSDDELADRFGIPVDDVVERLVRARER